MKEIFGLIPAAGKALRMRPFRYPKELLPVYYEPGTTELLVTPKLLIEYALDALNKAGVQNTLVIVPDWKPELMRYLEDGHQFGHKIGYLYNSSALGLAHALFTAHDWLMDKYTAFVMPDTVFAPKNALAMMTDQLFQSGADLVLGVFPVDDPENFAPVEFDKDLNVIQIEDKPVHPKFNNTWGAAVWTPSFWNFFESNRELLTPGESVSSVFNAAARSGLLVKCIYFSDGWYKDIGRINDIPKL